MLSFRAEFIFLENSWASFDAGGRVFWVFCFFGGGGFANSRDGFWEDGVF